MVENYRDTGTGMQTVVVGRREAANLLQWEGKWEKSWLSQGPLAPKNKRDFTATAAAGWGEEFGGDHVAGTLQ